MPFVIPWAFSIYKKIRKFPIGNFRLGWHGTGAKDNKSVNGTQIFHWEVSTGKTGLPFQEFRLFRKISSGTNQKVVFHLQPDRNFRNFLVNGKRSVCMRYRDIMSGRVQGSNRPALTNCARISKNVK